ncbi:MAG: aminoacyl-tRNA hydrolase [Anaerolineales bacterium]|nr:aminoacyl-tRNA hydrolase [Anaerolineales bacterium]
MIEVTDEIWIDEADLRFTFIQSSGPGGQNVNKVASGVQLRFDVHTPCLPEDVRRRLLEIARKRISAQGFLIIDAHRYRTQEQNRQDAIERLVEWVRKAAVAPKARKQTRPTAEARRRRLEAKRLRSAAKRLRQRVSSDDD